MGDLTEHFSRHEFACKCGCDKEIELGLVQRLERARWIRSAPIIITSGVRCLDQNTKVGGSPRSAHLVGWAADLRCSTSTERYLLLGALIHAGVNRIGIYSKHLHVDLDPRKPENLIWADIPATPVDRIFPPGPSTSSGRQGKEGSG